MAAYSAVMLQRRSQKDKLGRILRYIFIESFHSWYKGCYMFMMTMLSYYLFLLSYYLSNHLVFVLLNQFRSCPEILLVKIQFDTIILISGFYPRQRYIDRGVRTYTWGPVNGTDYRWVMSATLWYLFYPSPPPKTVHWHELPRALQLMERFEYT